jgi:hypothetical protein
MPSPKAYLSKAEQADQNYRKANEMIPGVMPSFDHAITGARMALDRLVETQRRFAADLSGVPATRLERAVSLLSFSTDDLTTMIDCDGADYLLDMLRDIEAKAAKTRRAIENIPAKG